MKQYNQIKSKYPDALLLFRVGDFYETFGEDAVKAANVLNIVLTKRKNGTASEIALAGFPHHSLDTYLPKLVRAGFRVAICDQLEDPKMTKTIVKRGVTELVTPGVSYNDKVLEGKQNNFLCAIHFNGNRAGVAFIDVSTGEFLVAEGGFEYVDKLIQGFQPKEILYQKGEQKKYQEHFSDKFYTYRLDDWVFTIDFANENLAKHFEVKSLKGFGIAHMDLATIAGSAVLHYLSETQHDKTAHIKHISRIEEDKYVWLDRFTIRNLELLYSYNEDATTLIDILDQTVTPPGSRMLKRWMVLPLKELAPIQERHEVVDYLIQHPEFKDELLSQLKEIGDLERIISKVATGRINPKEIVQLNRALTAIEPIKAACNKAKCKPLVTIADNLNTCEALKERIQREITEDPAVAIGKGEVIAYGVNPELDDLRNILNTGKDYLENLKNREAENTGIPSIKIAFNNVFGYYIEVRNTHKDKVPAEWIRKQTLVNAERYITEELKEYESKILGAEEKIHTLESQLLGELINAMATYITPIQHNAVQLAKLDCLHSFANIAMTNMYCKPEMNESLSIDIKDGRHPVIEHQLPVGEDYISNDVFLDNDRQQIIMITGPNMSGKSALLRQTAIISLMAQMGSFVPAASAKLGLVDKVFTRVGASDNISSGESTFMVEMNETASILNNLSERSLIILDEIGRGTSTYDGISIAWSITEYLHQNKIANPKTLFATHYHELNEMSQIFDRIKNYNVSVKEVGNKVIFMRKLVPGGSAHSFGIHVAKMAGMPKEVLQKAEQVLLKLEKNHSGDLKAEAKALAAEVEADMQLSFFQLDDPVLMQIKEEIENIDIDTLTPVEALMKLNEIKKYIGVK
ncbi:DNA mismatch repair protein MutS [Paracrocinitomix mangrovi]|uniref:DNA mismatch repair protein MutS n=1 Tax=Paracrocinitomix mangrovi TaxID=2862509 RepID=UPI001C8DBFE0|nr:DNA mismatch repair protein MutS [Paracrocinitomix mangrovi]UKN01124.1 DNA mismatch repair protein MutS [Paracrocinitomix mangrovi]